MLDVDRGGTNIASYAKGDLIAASATTTLSKLAVGTNGYILSANSSETTGLEWIENKVGTVTEVTVTAPLGVTSGTTTPALTVSTGTTSAVVSCNLLMVLHRPAPLLLQRLTESKPLMTWQTLLCLKQAERLLVNC